MTADRAWFLVVVLALMIVVVVVTVVVRDFVGSLGFVMLVPGLTFVCFASLVAAFVHRQKMRQHFIKRIPSEGRVDQERFNLCFPRVVESVE